MDKRQQIYVQHNGFKLKPISFVVCVLLTQVTWSQQVFADEVTDSNASVLPVMPPPKSAADTPLDVFDVLLGDAQVIKLPSTIEQYHIDNSIIRTAEVTEPKPSSDTTPNTINTPNKSLDTKALNKKEGANLPLGNARAGQEDKNIQLDKIQVRAKRFHEIGPLPGLGLTKEEIPGNVQSITAKEIKDSHSLSLTDLLNKKLQSVNVNDYQGNPFQMDVTYRGFTAGPQIGTPQGLSVFFDGIRVNEPFGDVVNWDMIPMNAIAGVDVFPGSNPIFGLNTLGGAFTLKTKDGFDFDGLDAEVLTGSYGRKQLQVEGGVNNGEFALFGAGNFFLEDGWRDNSPSKVNQFFGKASYRGDKLDLSLSTLLVSTDLVGNGLLPSEEYARDHSSVFTSPDTTKNRLAQFQLSGSYFVNDNFTITGQVYRRNSKRHQTGADVMTDYDRELTAQRLPAAGEQYTCLFNSTNGYGVPDYVVIPITNYDPSSGVDLLFDPNRPSGLSEFLEDVFTNNGAPGTVDIAAKYGSNQPITDETFLNAFRYKFAEASSFYSQNTYNRGQPVVPVAGNPDSNFFGEPAYSAAYVNLTTFGTLGTGINGNYNSGDGGVYIDSAGYYFTEVGGVITKNYVQILPPTNEANCTTLQNNGGFALQNPADPLNPTQYVDGRDWDQPGVVAVQDPNTGKLYYTPTALITDNQIDQVVDGASLQLNWNLEKHKFMVGASVDAAKAEYTNSQRLGLFDANRNGFLAPDQIHPMFAGAFIPISNSDFEGDQTTASVYFSETWNPVDTWNFNTSARYNITTGKNKIASRYGFVNYSIGDVISWPNAAALCPNGDCSNVPTGFVLPNISSPLDPAETEKFRYESFNPSLGATWQAKENLNIFANIAKGTRVPSVIELGCAFDKTPVQTPGGLLPKSIAENRACTLPSTLSGDPYLPQIRATTYDVGMRGTLNGLLGTDALEWNVGAYQTDLKDDIYFISVGNGQGFFDSIGNTRRRGLEAGLSGKKDKWGFGVNYSLTDATFQDSFAMISNDNSSATLNSTQDFGEIQVKPGNRMPGVPLHNLNANISYDVNDKWTVGLTAVAHSESFVRGNENNKHEKGVIRYVPSALNGFTALPPTNNPGKVPGYATFNFQTSYKFTPEWTATLLINNVFDKEYFTAGRLGRNPFSPSINGAIGPDGYNHNSYDWLSTNFIAPSAPRAAWISVRYEFVPDKKAEVSGNLSVEPNLSMQE
jgi:outer membrane receptor protein involved in Fe transport